MLFHVLAAHGLAMRHTPPPRMGAAAAAPTVELLQFLPMIPPLAPGTAASAVFRIDGGALSSPVWVAEEQAVAYVDRGQQALVRPDSLESLSMPASDASVSSHALLGGSALATCTGAGRGLRCVVHDPLSVGSLPLEGAGDVSGVSALCPLSDGRLLVATDDGRLQFLSREAPAVTLLEGLPAGSVRGAVASSDEKTLFLLIGNSVAVCKLQLDEGTCSAPQPMMQLGSSLADGSVVSDFACDVSGNLYIGASEGVLVVDDTGDAMIKLAFPQPVSGVCFGGRSVSELIVTTGDTLWRIQTSTQGAQPASPGFIKYMDKLAAAGEYRHEGW